MDDLLLLHRSERRVRRADQEAVEHEEGGKEKAEQLSEIPAIL
jgi:hypothetical protein